MGDYVYPSVFFSYFLFFLVTAGAYFCVRSASHGYWGPDGEDVKYRMLADDEETDHGRS
jgi:hypothetical protein